jgi:indoleamine 2,3-dioxygenase
MNRDFSTKGQGDFFLGKSDEPPNDDLGICGLAGSWTLDDNAGGLCHY